MASCTTNSQAPVIKVLNDNFGIQSGYIMVTSGKDIISLIPTSLGKISLQTILTISLSVINPFKLPILSTTINELFFFHLFCNFQNRNGFYVI